MENHTYPPNSILNYYLFAQKIAISTIFPLIAVLISSCVEVQAYRKGDKALESISNSDVQIRYVEYDEQGRPLDRESQIDGLMSQLKQLNNPIIVVYIHGWHHNARQMPEDSDVHHFKSFLSEIYNSESSTNKQIVLGVYVGWRGESIPSDNPITAIPSMLLTIWGRKAAAERVGNGNVIELISRLDRFRKTHGDSRLIFIGHSLGGVVLYHTLSHAIEESVGRAIDLKKSQDSPIVIDPLGDLAIVVNPALEAAQTSHLLETVMSQKYVPKKQRQNVVFITSTNDWATGWAFPTSNWFASHFLDAYEVDAAQDEGYCLSWLEPITYWLKIDNLEIMHNGKYFQQPLYADHPCKHMNTIGHYIPYVTHELAKKTDLNKSCPTAVVENLQCYGEDTNKTVLIRCDNEDDCKFVAPGHIKDKSFPSHAPLLNIRASNGVIKDHDDIWNEALSGFFKGFINNALTNPEKNPAPG